MGVWFLQVPFTMNFFQKKHLFFKDLCKTCSWILDTNGFVQILSTFFVSKLTPHCLVFTKGKHSNPWKGLELGPAMNFVCKGLPPNKTTHTDKTWKTKQVFLLKEQKQQAYTVPNNYIQGSAASFEGRGNFYSGSGIVFLLNFDGVVLRAVTICHGKINPETGPFHKRPFWKNIPVYIFMIIYEYMPL